MSRSLGLKLHSLLARGETAVLPEWLPRPDGKLVWMHAPGPVQAKSLMELARRIGEEDGYEVLLTCPMPLEPMPDVMVSEPPPDLPSAVHAFLDHWRPDAGLISDGELRPILLDQASTRGIPLVMVDARRPYLAGQKRSWLPGMVKTLVGLFSQIVAVDKEAARTFQRAGAAQDIVRAEGRMEEGSSVLPCTEAERAALVRLFATRPVWLAASLPEAEEAAVIAAHRTALRLSHRLLVIIVPEHPARGEALAKMIEDTEGWAVARRSAEEEPDEETEVFLADTLSEMGLWYRLAPITFLGGSLYGTGCLRDPFEPAALGSSILHGPRPGDWPDAFARLTEARAARMAGSPVELAEGLADLLSPDRAARLAQAAWAVASSGADVTDRAVEMVRALIEGRA
jgi:3-deoxy-D-manno-octulosonic-acid transferase